MEGNQYFEQQLKQFITNVKDEDLVKRSKECQFVLDNLLTNEVWKIVLGDCKKWCKQLDSQWAEVYDEKQLSAMRVLKLSYQYLFDLVGKYKEEYKYVSEELHKRNNANIQDKDYDTETLLGE